MKYIEYSFLGFDNSPLFDSSASKNIVEDLPNSFKLPMVYHTYIPLSGQDCQIAIRNLSLCLNHRISEFPDRRQVLIIFYDNPFIQDFEIQRKAYNSAYFVDDIRNCRPENAKITEEEEFESIRESALPIIPGFAESTIKSKYIDNFIYYLALKEFNGNSMLVHVPSTFDIFRVNELCKQITNFFF